MYARQEIVTIVTGESAGTGYTAVVNGRVLSIRYVATDYASSVDFAVTTETSGVNIWTEENVNASATRVPRQATHSTAGIAATYDATRAVLEPIVVANERIKIAVTNGGTGKTGTFYIVVG